MLTLTPEQENLIQEQQVWIEETRTKIALGIAELDRGEGVDGPTVMNQYLQQFQELRLISQ